MASRQPLPSLAHTAPTASRPDDTMDDDSVVESISEHIEIGSDASDVDDEDEPFGDDGREHMDRDHLNKRRQLFGIDDENMSSKFGMNNDSLDRLLSGDNIAQHFKIENDIDGSNDITGSHDVHLPDVASKNSSRITTNASDMTDELHGAATGWDDNMGGGAAAAATTSTRTNQDDRRSEKSPDDDDVILINDNEISIKSLKNLQTKSATRESSANTSSEVSDFMIENNESLSVRDIELDDSENVERSDERANSASQSRETSDYARTKSNDLSHHSASSSDNVVVKNIINEAIDKLPISIEQQSDQMTDRSHDGVIDDEDTGDTDEADRRGAVNVIINEAIDSLPIKQCTRISRDSLSEIAEDDEEMTIEILEMNVDQLDAIAIQHTDDAQLAEEPPQMIRINMQQSSTRAMDEPTAAANPTMISMISVDEASHITLTNAANCGPTTPQRQQLQSGASAFFADEINVNLMHMQNKIKELHDMAAGKYNCMIPSTSTFGVSSVGDVFSNSRRDSLKDQPQSARDSTSITTNSTEYRTFQDEYFNLNKVRREDISQCVFICMIIGRFFLFTDVRLTCGH